MIPQYVQIQNDIPPDESEVYFYFDKFGGLLYIAQSEISSKQNQFV